MILCLILLAASIDDRVHLLQPKHVIQIRKHVHENLDTWDKRTNPLGLIPSLESDKYEGHKRTTKVPDYPEDGQVYVFEGGGWVLFEDATHDTLKKYAEEYEYRLGKLKAEPSPQLVNPLEEIAKSMNDAKNHLGDQDGKSAKIAQERVTQILDELIKQNSPNNGGGNSNQNKPKSPQTSSRSKVKQQSQEKPGQTLANKSATKISRGASISPQEQIKRDTRELKRSVWGKLPQKTHREIMMQQADDRFLPKYDVMIEEYFKRLAEDNEPYYSK